VTDAADIPKLLPARVILYIPAVEPVEGEIDDDTANAGGVYVSKAELEVNWPETVTTTVGLAP
jgi:hypothetical protein